MPWKFIQRRPYVPQMARGLDPGAFRRLLAIRLLLLPILALPALGGVTGESATQASLVCEVSAPEADVRQAVDEVSRDQIVHGTYVYEKEKVLRGAHASTSSSAYRDWRESGKVFYKVADSVLDPRHFKRSNGTGTIAIRYVVQGIDAARTTLRIDAVFVEDSRRRTDPSDGSVESAEYEAVNQRLLVMSQQRKQVEQAKQLRDVGVAQTQQTASVTSPKTIKASSANTSSVEELEQRVAELRSQVEALVKDDGTGLRSAPFSRASLIQQLAAHTQVLIVVVTPYWYGVETPDGHRGWIRRRQLESLR